MSNEVKVASIFIEGAPPGELNDVVNDIKQLSDDSSLISKLEPAFQKYNEEQLTTAKLPGASQPVLISKYNKVPGSKRYFDTESRTSFEFDHVTQKASGSQSYTSESSHSDLISRTLKSLSTHFAEHYPPSSASAYTVCPGNTDSEIAILLSTTKASPNNFISGRWRSTFFYNPSSRKLKGTCKIHVHYYEDGNVALTTSKTIDVDDVEANGDAIVRKVAAMEKQYQEDVNRSLVAMNEGAFKGLRRQLPVTRQKMEWEKVRGYGLGGDLRGEGKR